MGMVPYIYTTAMAFSAPSLWTIPVHFISPTLCLTANAVFIELFKLLPTCFCKSFCDRAVFTQYSLLGLLYNSSLLWLSKNITETDEVEYNSHSSWINLSSYWGHNLSKERYSDAYIELRKTVHWINIRPGCFSCQSPYPDRSAHDWPWITMVRHGLPWSSMSLHGWKSSFPFIKHTPKTTN